MNKWQKILIVIFAAILLLGILKNVLIQSAITTVGSAVIGAPLKVGGFSLGILSQKVRIKNMKLYNPKGFPQDEPLIDIPEISVDADLMAFLKGKIHVPYVVVNVKQMTIIKDKEGKMNVDSLKVVEEQKDADKKDEKAGAKKPKDFAIAIDYMRLNVGEVVVKDYQKSDPPAVTAYQVGLKDKEFKNITSVAQLSTLIMLECMGPTGLRSAGLYAASTVLGVAFLPAGVAGVLLGDANAAAEYNSVINKVYDELIKVIQENNGKVKSQDKVKGMIKAVVQGADVSAKLETVESKTKVTIVARKMMIPKAEIAAGIIHQLSERVK